MVNVDKLKIKISEQGYTIAQIAKELDIDKSTLYRRLGRNGEDFSIKEAEKISKILGLKRNEVNDIFFDDKIAYKR